MIATRYILRVALSLTLAVATTSALALEFPQARWVFDRVIVPMSQFGGLGRPDNTRLSRGSLNRFVVRNGSAFHVFEQNGSLVASWTNCPATQTNAYGNNLAGKIVAWCNDSLRVYTEDGAPLGFPSMPYEPDGLKFRQVFVREDGTFLVLVSKQGEGGKLWSFAANNVTFLGEVDVFGPGGSRPTDFRGFLALGNGRYLVNPDLVINEDGSFAFQPSVNLNIQFPATMTDGYIVPLQTGCREGSKVLDRQFRVVGCADIAFGGGPRPIASGVYATGYPGVLSRSGTLDLLVPGGGLIRYRQASRSFPASSATLRSNPDVLAVASRSSGGSVVLDVDYIVHDSDSPTVTTAAIAFDSDGDSLDAVRKVTTLVEGTAVNVGASIATETGKRITWDVNQDLGTTGFAQLSVEILANDGRALVDLPFVEIPAGIPNGGDPLLTIATWPVAPGDLLSAWYWLIATADARISFFDGEVRGTAASGAFSGQLLASGTVTTTAGENFLMSILNVRRATQAEIDRARTGTTPGIQGYEPLARVAGYPGLANEIGVDVESGGLWVVRLP